MEENKAFGELTTLGVGGPARWFARAESEADVSDAAEWARERGLVLFVLGGGSNLVVADEGFEGLVVQVALHGVEKVASGDEVRFRVAAGENWDEFVQRAVEENCAGIECLAGIPGTVGGTPVQNVGAYGQEVAEVIECVRAFDLRGWEFVELAAEECGFEYRRSRFNTADRGRFIVTRVDFRLKRNGKPMLRYGELQRAFGEGATPKLREVTEAVRRIRQAKGMLLVEGDADCHSAGSFFKNPVVSEEQAQEIALSAGEAPPRFSAGDGAGYGARVKIPAAWLIERAGFRKGYARGAAGISTKHTLALVNRGGATAGEVVELAEEIRRAVEVRFGVLLSMEPVRVGFAEDEVGAS